MVLKNKNVRIGGVHPIAYIGKRFGTLKRNLGFDERKVFHSIRKTVSTLFERADINHNKAAEIIGHEKTGMTYGLYSAGSDLTQKYEVIKVIDYEENTI